VNIFRLVCKSTVEENILKKAQQKRQLGVLAIEGGGFTTDFFAEGGIRDLFGVEDRRGAKGKAKPGNPTDTDVAQVCPSNAP
jgi:hypothetical protein